MELNLEATGAGENKKFPLESFVKHLAHEITIAQKEYH